MKDNIVSVLVIVNLYVNDGPLIVVVQSVSNVLETALGCERVLSSLPMVRWAQPVFDSATQLLESATSFIAANMSGVLASDRYCHPPFLTSSHMHTYRKRAICHCSSL